MSIIWSGAATGLAICFVSLVLYSDIIRMRGIRPGILQSPAWMAAFVAIGVLLTLLMFYFGFRLFWDNGLWALLQLVIVIVVAGLLSGLALLQNALTPFLGAGLAVVQAVNVW